MEKDNKKSNINYKSLLESWGLKDILDNEEKLNEWHEHIKWHIKKTDELGRENEILKKELQNYKNKENIRHFENFTFNELETLLAGLNALEDKYIKENTLKQNADALFAARETVQRKYLENSDYLVPNKEKKNA